MLSTSPSLSVVVVLWVEQRTNTNKQTIWLSHVVTGHVTYRSHAVSHIVTVTDSGYSAARKGVM